MNIYLICTHNNTRLILSRNTNQIIFQYTTGMMGLKGSTRSSIYGGEKLLKKFISRISSAGLYYHNYVLLVKGFSPSRNIILRRLLQLKINLIKDITSFPHNGCRKKKSLR